MSSWRWTCDWSSEHALPALSPSSYAALIPPLLALPPGVVDLLCVAVPSHPLGGLALGGGAPITLEEALLQGAADHFLLGDALAELLIEGGWRERGQGAVHLGLLLAPLPLEGVGGEELGLRRRTEVNQARLELVQSRSKSDVLVEGGLERPLGGGGRRVRGGTRRHQRAQQLRASEEVGEILLTVRRG